MPTITNYSHDGDGEDELQRSQGIFERLAIRYVHGHDVSRSVKSVRWRVQRVTDIGVRNVVLCEEKSKFR